MIWLKRNALAFVILAAALGVFIGYVAYPQWQKQLGKRNDAAQVAAGQTIRIGDVDWGMRRVPPEDLTLEYRTSSTRLPDTLKAVGFVFERSRDGAPVTMDDVKGWRCYNPTAVDARGRSWVLQNHPYVNALTYRNSPATSSVEECNTQTTALFDAKMVPADADIVGMLITFRDKESGVERFVFFRG